MMSRDVQTTRQFLGLTPEQLASELDVTPAVIIAWERGETSPSKHHLRLLEWHRAVRERQQLMHTKGLAQCSTARQLLEDLMKAPRAGTREQRALDEHEATCPTCIATAAYEKTLPPLPDYPLGPLNRAFTALPERIGRLPPWARPAAWGAVFIGALVLLRAFAFLLLGNFDWRVLIVVPLGLLLGGYLGAVGGIVYYFVRPRTRQLGRWGDYLTGMACAGGYLLAFLLPAAIAGDEMGRDPVAWVSAGIMAVVFGLAVGHFAFREL